jgi:antitoxin component of RelBE/YafQ-DinJ toxin-antitoxin module
MAEAIMENLSVRVPSSEKALFNKITRRNGTDAAAAIRTFVHAFNIEGGYPFDTTQYYPIDNEEEAEIAMFKARLRAGTLEGYSDHRELREDSDL